MAERAIELLERGSIYFLVQPRVERREIERLADVQRTLMVLHPEDAAHYRRVVLGHKRLPRPGRRERFWSFIDRVGTLQEVLADLAPYHYETKTRGVRYQPGAKLVGLGRYAIAHHEGSHTHFDFELDTVDAADEVRSAIALPEDGRFLLLAMRPPPGRRGSWQWQSLPQEVKAHFGDSRFASIRRDLLDREGMSLVLIPVRHSIDLPLGEVPQGVEQFIAAWVGEPPT